MSNNPDQVSHLAHQARHVVQGVPAQATRRTCGNLLAAGLIALDAGWLIGSLVPASRAEQDAAATGTEHVKAEGQERVEELKDDSQRAAHGS